MRGREREREREPESEPASLNIISQHNHRYFKLRILNYTILDWTTDPNYIVCVDDG